MNVKNFKQFTNEGFIPMVSNDTSPNDRYIVGNYVVFNYFLNNKFGDKPYRFVGKILSKNMYHRIQVEVINQLLSVVVNGVNTVKDDNQSGISIGSTILVHCGNIISQTSNLGSIKDSLHITKNITIRSKTNNLFHYDITVDENNVVKHIYNEWDVTLPVWVLGKLDLISLQDYFNKKRPEFYIEK